MPGSSQSFFYAKCQKKLVASSGNNVASGVINLTRCTAPLGEKLVAFMRQGAFGCKLVVLGIQPDDCDAEVLCPS
jgi:hypothetical protein